MYEPGHRPKYFWKDRKI